MLAETQILYKMKEPISTYTNLAYIVAGVAMWNPVLTTAHIILGITSGGYHWTKNRLWQKLDVRAMFLVFGAHMWNFIGSWEAALMIGLAVILTWVRESDFSTEVTIPYMFLITAALALSSGVSWFFLIVFIIALVCNIPFLYLNLNKGVTDVLHGLWHILTAYGFYLLM